MSLPSLSTSISIGLSSYNEIAVFYISMKVILMLFLLRNSKTR